MPEQVQQGSDNHQTKIIISVATALTVAALLWVGTTLTNNQIALTKLQAEILHLRTDLQKADSDTKSYRLLVNSRIRELEKRVNHFEARQ